MVTVYKKLRFDKKTGRYVIHSTDLADATNKMTTDIEHKIQAVWERLESAGKVSYTKDRWGAKKHLLNAVQLFILIQEFRYLDCDEVSLIQGTMIAAAHDDSELAISLHNRKLELGIK